MNKNIANLEQMIFIEKLSIMDDNFWSLYNLNCTKNIINTALNTDYHDAAHISSMESIFSKSSIKHILLSIIKYRTMCIDEFCKYKKEILTHFKDHEDIFYVYSKPNLFISFQKKTKDRYTDSFLSNSNSKTKRLFSKLNKQDSKYLLYSSTKEVYIKPFNYDGFQWSNINIDFCNNRIINCEEIYSNFIKIRDNLSYVNGLIEYFVENIQFILREQTLQKAEIIMFDMEEEILIIDQINKDIFTQKEIIIKW
jgi:hypothetical protein